MVVGDSKEEVIIFHDRQTDKQNLPIKYRSSFHYHRNVIDYSITGPVNFVRPDWTVTAGSYI